MMGNSYPHLIERPSFQALYAFTPFKILESSSNAYTILLVPLKYFEINHELEWFKLKDRKRIKGRNEKEVIIPAELYPQTFTNDNDNIKHTYLYKRSEKDLKSNQQLYERNLPLYMEFSYEALQEPYVCKLGYVVLCSSPICPIIKYCLKVKRDKLRRGNCQHYVKVNNTYAGLYYVYPEIEKELIESEDHKEVITIPSSKGFPLITIKFIEEGSVLGYIDTIVFIPKIHRIILRQRFIFYPNPTLGIELKNIHALIFEFEIDQLRDIIREIFKRNKRVYEWLAFKYYFGRYLSDQRKKIVDGFKGFDLLSLKFKEISERSFQSAKDLQDEIYKAIEKNEEDFINFVSFVLLHTLAHTLIVALSVKYDIPEDCLCYIIDHPILKNNQHGGENIKLYIFEDAVGGYGYLKNFIEYIKEKKDTQVLCELFKYIQELIEKEDQKLGDYEKTFNDLLNYLNNIAIKGEVEKIKSRLEKVTEFIKKVKIYPHVMTFRAIFLDDIKLGDSELRKMLEDVFSNLPLCWDGCPCCVMMEKGCIFSPFDQPFVLSKYLVKEFVEEIIKVIEEKRLSNSFYFTNVKDYVDKIISEAKKSILISTPFLSQSTLDKISSLLEKNHNLQVKILTHKNCKNDKILSSKLMNMINKYKNFKIKFHDKLHAKGLLIDDLILLSGSFNLTTKGLESNVENIYIIYHPEEISKFRERFEEEWNNSLPF